MLNCLYIACIPFVLGLQPHVFWHWFFMLPQAVPVVQFSRCPRVLWQAQFYIVSVKSSALSFAWDECKIGEVISTTSRRTEYILDEIGQGTREQGTTENSNRHQTGAATQRLRRRHMTADGAYSSLVWLTILRKISDLKTVSDHASAAEFVRDPLNAFARKQDWINWQTDKHRSYNSALEEKQQCEQPSAQHIVEHDSTLWIQNKNLAIANKSRVSYAHNTLRASNIGINITPWPWNLS